MSASSSFSFRDAFKASFSLLIDSFLCWSREDPVEVPVEDVAATVEARRLPLLVVVVVGRGAGIASTSSFSATSGVASLLSVVAGKILLLLDVRVLSLALTFSISGSLSSSGESSLPRSTSSTSCAFRLLDGRAARSSSSLTTSEGSCTSFKTPDFLRFELRDALTRELVEVEEGNTKSSSPSAPPASSSSSSSNVAAFAGVGKRVEFRLLEILDLRLFVST